MLASSLTAPRPAWRQAAAATLLAAGLVLFGQGLWIQAKAVLAQILLDRAFAQTLATGQAVKPWPWADTWPVARVVAPRLGKSAIVLHGSSGQVLAFGPGHVEGTPQPGEPGTAVLSAHRDTHFAFLRDIQVGDFLHVTRRDGTALRFRATGASVVRWDASGIDPLAGPADARALDLLALQRQNARAAAVSRRGRASPGARCGQGGSPDTRGRRGTAGLPPRPSIEVIGEYPGRLAGHLLAMV
jgi:sortase A